MKRISRRRLLQHSGAVCPLTGALATEIVNTPHPNVTLPLAGAAGLPRLGNRTIRLV